MDEALVAGGVGAGAGGAGDAVAAGGPMAAAAVRRRVLPGSLRTAGSEKITASKREGRRS